jgi:peroxiredoxin
MLPPGTRAPEIVLPDLAGIAVTISELVHQGPLLIAFFKITCPTCQYAFPFLQRFSDKNALTVIGVSQDEAGPTQTFCKKYGVRFPVLLDSARKGYAFSNAYQITSVPSIFLVEPDGVISRAVSGFSRQDLEDIAHRFNFRLFAANEQVPAFKPG